MQIINKKYECYFFSSCEASDLILSGHQMGHTDEHGNLTSHMSSLMNSSSPGSTHSNNESSGAVNNGGASTTTVTKVRTPRTRQKKAAVAPYTVPSEQISPVCVST